jgi:hypothetical protein
MATTNCGTMMQAAMIRLAFDPARIVTAEAASGSIPAFARWNNVTQMPNTSSRRSSNSFRKPSLSNPWLVVCWRA